MVGKCQFAMSRCVYLGRVVGSGSLQPEKTKLTAVKEFPTSETKHQVRGFLGLAEYYRRLIPDLFIHHCSINRLASPNCPGLLLCIYTGYTGTCKNQLCRSNLL